MSPDERTNLSLFLEQLIRARGVRKDPEAEQMIQRALEQQPDAGYLLVQRVSLLERALDEAKARITALESELKTAQGSDLPAGGEVGALARGWGRSNAATGTLSAPAGTPVNPQPIAAPAGNSWLGQMASTAAGVAAGAFLFQGIEDLLSRGSGLGGHAGTPNQHLVEADTFNPPSGSDPDLQDLSQTSNDFDDSGALDDDADAAFGDDSEMI